MFVVHVGTHSSAKAAPLDDSSGRRTTARLVPQGRGTVEDGECTPFRRFPSGRSRGTQRSICCGRDELRLVRSTTPTSGLVPTGCPQVRRLVRDSVRVACEQHLHVAIATPTAMVALSGEPR